MFKRIIVPLDGSKDAEQAIPVAARVARASDGTIVLVHVVLPPVEFGTYTESRTVTLKPTAFAKRLTEAANYLKDIVIAHTSDLAGIDVVMKAVAGAASPTIFSVVKEEHGDLVVMCSRGEHGLKSWIFGSVAHEAVRHSPAPVLVLSEKGMAPAPKEVISTIRILVALDGSPLAETAIVPAAQLVSALAGPAQGALHLFRDVDIHSVPPKFRGASDLDATIRDEARQEAEAYLKDVTDRVQGSLADYNLILTSSVAVGVDAVDKIVEQAGQVGGYDLIAMTTHGRTGLQRLFMGSVAEKILSSTKLPVLVVRPHDIEAQSQQET
jgi:nucleotide-binding universal stress UspA family protein